MIIKNIIAFLILAIVQQLAHATSYYVNSEFGNDSWSGKSPVAAGNPSMDGPWQTLGRLSTISLNPGDTVQLACGSQWNETLRIASSGSNASPITISAGPGACEQPPLIDGAIALPNHIWTQYKGAIYRARLPLEYISNSALSENLNGWTNWSPRFDASMSLDTICSGSPLPCMGFVSGTGSGTSLAISNNFSLVGGADYSASALVKAPANTRLKFVIRRGGPTYESLTADQDITGTGNWQTVSFTFRSNRSAPNARFDIEVPNGQVKINLREAHVKRAGPVTGVIGVFVDGAAIRRAHHPNFGRAGVDPDSPFAIIASAGGKTTVDTAGLALPSNGNLTRGLGVSVRTESFAMEERTVAAVTGTRLTLDQPTSYFIRPGYGYFLTGALWMLDSAGEWYFDSSTGDLYVWMPDGAPPGGRVSFNSLAVGIDLKARAFVDLVGLNVKRVGTGVQLGKANTVRMRRMGMAEFSDYGIDADNSRACEVDESGIESTGLDAVKAAGADTTGFVISNSRVAYSGVEARPGGWRTLPRPARGAINVGQNASVFRNEILSPANNGVSIEANSTVEGNYVSRACLRYTDCGGIYADYAANNSSIVGNMIDTVRGDIAGLPTGWPGQAVGIYLDNWGSGITIRKNTVTNADYGIQVHNTNSSTITENLLFGNRRYQIWMQEDTAALRSKGDIFGNRVESNLLVPLGTGPSVFMESELGDTGDFAIFSGNHYSALLSSRPIGELWPTGSAGHTLDEWMAGGQDPNARVTQPTGYASFLVRGGNIVPNSSFGTVEGWSWWNEKSPYAQMTLLSCDFGPCLQIRAGASPSLLVSPNFSITGGQLYRVSFDAVTSQAGQSISVMVRRGGGGTANYETLMPAPESFSGSSRWHRYSFVFRASKTVVANDPSTGERGARVDFEIQPGSSLTLAHLEMVPLKSSEVPLQLRLQLNTSNDSAVVPCTSEDEAASLCSKFIDIKDERIMDWSAPVAPRSGNALYTRDTSLADTDGDGIADVQDACPATPNTAAVNANGCGFDQ